MGLGSKVGPGNKVGLGNKVGPPIHILPAGYTLTGYYIALSIGPFVGIAYVLPGHHSLLLVPSTGLDGQ